MNKRRPQNCENELVGGFEENPNMEVSCRRNDCFHFSAWNQGVHGLHTKIARILIGTSTSNMINNIPWLKTHGHLKAVLLVTQLLPESPRARTLKAGRAQMSQPAAGVVVDLGETSFSQSWKWASWVTRPPRVTIQLTAGPIPQIPCATGCRRATMASLPGPDLGTEACGSTGTEASASSAGATGSGTTGEASGTSCLGIWGVHWPKLMKFFTYIFAFSDFVATLRCGHCRCRFFCFLRGSYTVILRGHLSRRIWRVRA